MKLIMKLKMNFKFKKIINDDLQLIRLIQLMHLMQLRTKE